MNARDVFASSTVSQIPVVPTVTCPRCETRWNAKAFTVREGRCTCGAPLGASDDDEPARSGRLTRQEFLEGLADRGIDTFDDYNETK
jgi:hypothetical protein